MVAGRELTPAGWRTFGAIVVSLAILAAGGIWYTSVSTERMQRQLREADRQDDARWCALLVTLDQQYRAAPPATETGRGVAAAIASLRESFGCPVR